MRERERDLEIEERGMRGGDSNRGIERDRDKDRGREIYLDRERGEYTVGKRTRERR